MTQPYKQLAGKPYQSTAFNKTTLKYIVGGTILYFGLVFSGCYYIKTHPTSTQETIDQKVESITKDVKENFVLR